jgi:hypothetical protein
MIFPTLKQLRDRRDAYLVERDYNRVKRERLDHEAANLDLSIRECSRRIEGRLQQLEPEELTSLRERRSAAMDELELNRLDQERLTKDMKEVNGALLRLEGKILRALRRIYRT